MKLKTEKLWKKLEPYFSDPSHRVHNHALLQNELSRRVDWRICVLKHCDNYKDFFPNGPIRYDWRYQRYVRIPKRWRIPKEVFIYSVHCKYFHIVQVKPNVLKVVRIKPKPKKGYTLYIDTVNQHVRLNNFAWYKPKKCWSDFGCDANCEAQTCRHKDFNFCLHSVMEKHGFDTSVGNCGVKEVMDRNLNDFKYQKL